MRLLILALIAVVGLGWSATAADGCPPAVKSAASSTTTTTTTVTTKTTKTTSPAVILVREPAARRRTVIREYEGPRIAPVRRVLFWRW